MIHGAHCHGKVMQCNLKISMNEPHYPDGTTQIVLDLQELDLQDGNILSNLHSLKMRIHFEARCGSPGWVL